MDHINHLSLKDRTLWLDGSTTVPANEIAKYLTFVDTGNIFVDEMTADIEEFNKLSEKKITIKDGINELSTKWVIPQSILDLDIRDYLDNKLAKEIESGDFNEEEINERIDRLDIEYKVMEMEELIPVLYAIIHVINTFEENDIVWGVGRGSSTSSYVLFLIGAHDVDSVKYDLDFSEFIH